MPNPDGSPTREELLAANPWLAQGGAPPAPPPPGPSLQSQMAGAGVLGYAQGLATEPPPVSTSAGMAHGAAPPDVASAPTPHGFPSLREQTARGPSGSIMHLWNTKPTPEQARVNETNAGGGVRYSGGGGAGGGNLQTQAASGFFVPMGAGKAAGPGPNPYKNQIAAIDKAQTEGERLNGLQREAARGNQNALQRNVEEMNAMQADHVASAEKHADRVQRASEAYQRVLEDAPHESINAGRWWGSRSTGQNLALILATGLSGFAAHVSGQGGNPVLDQINREIDRDIGVQKANIAERREGYNAKVSGAKTTYEMIRQSVQDDEAAAALTKAWTFDRMAAEAQQRAAVSGDITQQQNAQQFADQLGLHKAELQDKAALRLAKGGAAEFDRGKFIAQKNIYTAQGIPSDKAELQAARDLGYTRDAGVTVKREGGGSEDKRDKAATEARALIDVVRNTDWDKVAAGAGRANQLYGEHAPGWAPGAQSSRRDVSLLKKSQVDMMKAAGATWKMTTGGVEPKNPHLIEEIVAPFIPEPNDDAQTMRWKAQQAEDAVRQAAAAEGVTGAELPGERKSLMQSVAGFKPAGSQ